MGEFAIQTLGELVEFVKGLSPALWEIALRQVQSIMAARLFWLVICVGLVFACQYWYKWLVKRKPTDRSDAEEYEILMFIAGAIGAIAALVSLILMGSIIRLVINPDFYAIKVLRGMLTGSCG